MPAEESAVQWKPGQRIELLGPRVFIRTMRVSDAGDVARWYGDEETYRFVWKPNLSPEDYVKGLVAASDQITKFAFVFGPKDGAPIGHAKLQISEEYNGIHAAPTFAIGDREKRGAFYGRGASAALHWFAFEYLDADVIAPRIYEENARLVELMSKRGFEATKRYQPRGDRPVVVFELDREGWLRRYSTERDFTLRVLPD
jgi:RimJ/RimL family protein N-acetyltransferase